jgi:hypothetical protein
MGQLLIDGNHRAARALRRREDFLTYLLPDREARIFCAAPWPKIRKLLVEAVRKLLIPGTISFH